MSQIKLSKVYDEILIIKNLVIKARKSIHRAILEVQRRKYEDAYYWTLGLKKVLKAKKPRRIYHDPVRLTRKAVDILFDLTEQIYEKKVSERFIQGISRGYKEFEERLDENKKKLKEAINNPFNPKMIKKMEDVHRDLYGLYHEIMVYLGMKIPVEIYRTIEKQREKIPT
ncbi:hypothetical protein ACFL1H_07425 [Nanoarchaeota archaeon]